MAAPVAMPIWCCVTAFCMHTVEIGNTVPSPTPMSVSSASTRMSGIETGQIASAASAKSASVEPISGMRL